MNAFFVLPLSFFLLAACTQNAPFSGAPTEADYVFEDVNIIPMDEETVMEKRAVAVKDGEILAIVDQADADAFTAVQRIDGKDRYLMPGLSDMHVHVRWESQTMFNLFLAKGVTTVANMGSDDGGFNHLQLREAIASGERLGPRYIVSGPHLQGEHPASVSEAEQVLDDHVEQGFNPVKIHGDLPEDIYDALIDGARARGLRTAGHAQHAMPLEKSLQLDRLEHMEEFLYTSPDPEFAVAAKDDLLSAYRANVKRLWDPDVRASIVREVAASGVYIDPTLIAYSMIQEWADDDALAAMADDPRLSYLPPDVRERWLSTATNPYQQEGFPITPDEVARNVELLSLLMKELHDAGVPLLLGTDTFGTLLPGFSTHRELALMVEAGLTPYQALRTGTVNVAAYLGEVDTAGAIREGYRADFILLDDNPLADIANSESVSGVFTQESWHSRADLAALRNLD